MKALPILLALSISALADDRAAPANPPAEFKVTTRRADDAVTVWNDKGRTVVAVRSPFGISRAVLERRGDTWPEVIVLRLHLKGLSSFRASNGEVTVDAAVS